MADGAESRKSLVQRARDGHEERFGGPPRWTVVAPGRVNLIGDHTDYSGGLAMPFAIERYTVLCASPGAGAKTRGIRAVSSSAGTGATIALDDRPLANHRDWTRYLRGVANGFRGAGITLESLDIYCHSNVPSGAGLSSSAALEVAMGCAIESAAGVEHDPARMVRICRQAEHEYAGVPCGALDQFSVTYARKGHVMLFDSRSLSADQLPFTLDDAELVILDSRVKHALAQSEYPKRRRECAAVEAALPRGLRETALDELGDAPGLSDPLLRRRATHVITENERVRRFAAALQQEDVRTAGAIMYESHDSLARDYEVSCRETDLLVELLSDPVLGDDVFGARMTGGGFGGSVIALVRAGASPAIGERIAAAYLDATGLELSAMRVSPQQGVQTLHEDMDIE